MLFRSIFLVVVVAPVVVGGRLVDRVVADGPAGGNVCGATAMVALVGVAAPGVRVVEVGPEKPSSSALRNCTINREVVMLPAGS